MSKRAPLLFVLSLFVIAASSALPHGYATFPADCSLSSPATVSGTVYGYPVINGVESNYLKKLPGATVTASPGGVSATTPDDGSYSLTLQPGPQGSQATYTITASVSGYTPMSTTVTVSACSSTSGLDFYLVDPLPVPEFPGGTLAVFSLVFALSALAVSLSKRRKRE